MAVKTYRKHAEKSEYDHHCLAYEAGVSAPRIAAWDPVAEMLETEMIPGVDVIGYLRRGYTRSSVIAVCVDLAKQMKKLHNLGYLHGDVKSANIIITPRDEVFLIDFEFTGAISSGIVRVGNHAAARGQALAAEMMELIKVLTILLAPLPLIISRLMLLCEETGLPSLPFALRGGVTHDDIIAVITL